jgi:nitronate monooxygenase
LASEEICIPDDNYRQTILQGKDGAQYTVRNNVFDELRGPNIWPEGYKGRAVVSTSYREFREGVSVEELRKRTRNAEGEKGRDYGVNGRSAVWAGAGIGLVNEIQSAKTIVEEVRKGAVKILQGAGSRV